MTTLYKREQKEDSTTQKRTIIRGHTRTNRGQQEDNTRTKEDNRGQQRATENRRGQRTTKEET